MDPSPVQIMYKNRNITDFFKPFANPRPPKRPRENDNGEDTTASRERRSGSPRLEAAEQVLPFHSSPPKSSQTSALTSLRSDGSTIRDLEGTEETPESPTRAVLESFGSNGPILASSQRIMRNGEVMIRNSDDESDSDASLDDIDELLAANRKPISHSSPPTEPDFPSLPTQTPARPIRRSGMGRSTKSLKGGRRFDISPPKPRISLDTLVAQAEADDAAEAGIDKARLLIGALDERRDALQLKLAHSKGDAEVDKSLLASIAKKHGEKEGKEELIDKLMQAIERTEALERPETWSFFKPGHAEPPPELPVFPSVDRRSPLYSVLNNSSDCQTSIVNGFLGEVAHKGRLPDEIIQWILSASCIEFTESLRSACLSILTCAGARVTPYVTSDMITSLLRSLGATDEALDKDSPVVPVLQLPSHGDQNPPGWTGLRNVLKLIAGVAEWIDSPTRSHTLCLLLRLTLDASVIADRANLEAIEDAIENLITAIPRQFTEEELLTLTSTTFPQISSPPLRLQLLRSLPTYPASLAILRRRLALAFFFSKPTPLSAPPDKLISFKRIIARLRTPDFRINSSTDYAALAATISTLDIGLDDGDPPSQTPISQSPTSPSSSGLFSTDLPPTNVPLPSTLPTNPTPRDPKLDDRFNARVDRLAAVVKSIYSQIVDTGASHMLRTEAKEVLETFHSRLVHAVRTVPRRKETFFGVRGFEAVPGVGEFMRRFLARQKGLEGEEEMVGG
ncbi:hypothetical protein MMC30_008633 [Trapelia coarctata]|nr:hypothetical protein [Trapelia coarctata]